MTRIQQINEKKYKEFKKLLLTHNVSINKFLLIDSHKCILISNDTFDTLTSTEKFGYILPKKISRGDILDTFSKIEFIIDEIIFKYLCKDDFELATKIEPLTKTNLNTKLNLLYKDWAIIDKETHNLLIKIKKVRNVLAHRWIIHNAVYGEDKTISTNFKEFKKDLVLVWKNLVKTYQKLYDQNKLLEETITNLKYLFE